MNFLNAFLNLREWFEMTPPILDFLTALILLLANAAILVLGIVFLVLASKHSRLDYLRAKGESKLAGWFLFWSVAGICWTFFAYENISLFGAFFWWPIGLVSSLVWLVFIILYFARTIPRLKASLLKKKEKQKYLPRKKSR